MTRAILLSAGQGKRLLPSTANLPKCLLPIDADRSSLELQLRSIARCGIDRATVLTGFGAELVEEVLAQTHIPRLSVDTIFNPVYSVTDNLITCWLAQAAMTEDFLLLNGDTLFEDSLLRHVLDGPEVPVTITVDHKNEYDEDDMKVSFDPDGRLRAVGKKLPPESVDGESIGMLLFRDSGVEAFRDAINRAVRRREALRAWYLSVVNELAQRIVVKTRSIKGLWWQEVDCHEDLAKARAHYATAENAKEPIPAVETGDPI